MAVQRAGSEDKRIRRVRGAIRVDVHAVALRLPAQQRLAPVDLRAVSQRSIDITHDAALWRQEAAIFLVERHAILRQAVAGEALAQFDAGEHLVLDPHRNRRLK